jgi:hypothetical protein
VLEDLEKNGPKTCSRAGRSAHRFGAAEGVEQVIMPSSMRRQGVITGKLREEKVQARKGEQVSGKSAI